MSKPELNLKLGTLTSFVSTFLGFTRCEPEAERIDYLDALNIRDHIRILLDKIR